MKVDKDNPPPLPNWCFGWERGKDPFHKDAFKGVPIPQEQIDAVANHGDRVEGWFGLDGAGNEIAFVVDGTEFEDK